MVILGIRPVSACLLGSVGRGWGGIADLMHVVEPWQPPMVIVYVLAFRLPVKVLRLRFSVRVCNIFLQAPDKFNRRGGETLVAWERGGLMSRGASSH